MTFRLEGRAIASYHDHIAVLPVEVMEHLCPGEGARVVDATIGLGGHTALLLKAIGPQGQLIGLDVDDNSLDMVRTRFESTPNITLFRENFANLEDLLARESLGAVDAILADLGVSSPQLDQAQRGFSFNHDGPLDMRMDHRLDKTAADLVNGLDEGQLADLIYQLSQERGSRRIAKAIRRERHKARISRTAQLADIVCRALNMNPNSYPGKIHPATRTFMALRMAVNHELPSLERFLDALPRVLAPGGRAAVISFHSLEDGLCKRAFRKMKQDGLANIITKKPIIAGQVERRENPRARSAKLRVIERTTLAAVA